MIPLALNPSRLNLALAGVGAPALRRLRGLRAAGAQRLSVFSTDPAILDAAGGEGLNRLPRPDEVAGWHVLWMVGLEPAQYRPLAEAARAANVLVNVEDVPEFCDFNSVAEIRRGDFLLTISTGGQAPGLAGALRRRLEACFPESWAARVKEIAALRQGWQAEHVPMPEAARRIDDIVEQSCWLSCPKSK